MSTKTFRIGSIVVAGVSSLIGVGLGAAWGAHDTSLSLPGSSCYWNPTAAANVALGPTSLANGSSLASLSVDCPVPFVEWTDETGDLGGLTAAVLSAPIKTTVYDGHGRSNVSAQLVQYDPAATANYSICSPVTSTSTGWTVLQPVKCSSVYDAITLRVVLPVVDLLTGASKIAGFSVQNSH